MAKQNGFDWIEDFLGNKNWPFGKTNKEETEEDKIRRKNEEKIDKFIETFETLIINEDKKTLEKAVVIQSEKIKSMNHPDVFRINVVACLFVENYALAFDSVEKLKDDYGCINEVKALIHYSMGNYGLASKEFRKVEFFTRPETSLLVRAISEWYSGLQDVFSHELNLAELTQSSANANTFLGTIFYNKGHYARAQEYFNNIFSLPAAETLKTKETLRLNALRAEYKVSPNSAIMHISEFLHETGSKLSADEISEQLSKTELEVPVYKIKIHSLVDKML